MMGAALAEALLRAGHPITVWNRTPDRADKLVALGATRSADVAAAVRSSALVIVCLSTYETVYAALGAAEGELAGKVLVNLTSGTPDQARAMGTWAAERDVGYLDGAIMAVPPLIGKPQALIFYGGDRTQYAQHEATLGALGGATYLGPDAGLPLLYDVALLGVLWSTLAGYLHALALIGTADVAAGDFHRHAQAWMEHAVVPSLAQKAAEVDRGDYATQVSTLSVNQAAIAHLIDASQERGINADMMLAIQGLIDRRVADGHESESLASLIEAIRAG